MKFTTQTWTDVVEFIKLIKCVFVWKELQPPAYPPPQKKTPAQQKHA